MGCRRGCHRDPVPRSVFHHFTKHPGVHVSQRPFGILPRAILFLGVPALCFEVEVDFRLLVVAPVTEQRIKSTSSNWLCSWRITA